MATEQQILELRRRIAQPDNAEPWTDEYLGSLIDTYGMNIAAAESWEQKAAIVIDLVNISEGGSSRSNGQLHDHYLSQAKRFRDTETAGDGTGRAPRTREAVRQ